MALIVWGALGGGTVAAGGAGAPALRQGSQLTFAELGWDEDRVLSSGSDRASVAFTLPAGAEQGGGIWYAAQIAYEWSGVPPVDQPAYLYGLWNGQAMYQLKVKRNSDYPIGAFQWSMADAIWGGSGGTEYSSRFVGRSTNFAVVSAIKPGENVLELRLDLTYAPSADVHVRIMRDSRVISTAWGPPTLTLKGGADLRDGVLTLDVVARNRGVPAGNVDAYLVVSYAGRESQTVALGEQEGLHPKDRWPISATVQLEGRDPISAHVLLAWGSGRAPYRVWPSDRNRWWPWTPPSSMPLVLAAMTVLWISVPATLRKFRVQAGRS